MKKSIQIFGKTIPVWLLAGLLSVGLGSAALLTYYGTITTSVNVEQSILLDGKDVKTGSLSVSDVIAEDAPGGEKFCFKHTLTNQMSVAGDVKLETSISGPCAGLGETDCQNLGCTWDGQKCVETGVQPSCLESNDYSFGPQDSVSYSGNSPVSVKVEDDGNCQVKFTFDFPIDQNQGNGNMGYGLIISTNGVHPAFQVHNNDGTCSAFSWGAHLYSEWDPSLPGNWNGWNTGGVNCANTNTPVSSMSWITADGHRYKDGKPDDTTPNPEGKFVVTIDKCALGVEHIYWAAHFGSGGFYSPYGGQSTLPAGFTWTGSGDVNPGTNYLDAQVGKVCSNPLSIASGETEPFCLCYAFDTNIYPGTYTLTTNVVPQ